MNKFKKGLLLGIALASVFTMSQVNASTGNFESIENLCVKKNETSVVMQFDVLNDYDFSKLDEQNNFNILLQKTRYGSDNVIGTVDNIKLVDHDTTCETENITGESVASKTVSKGSRLSIELEAENLQDYHYYYLESMLMGLEIQYDLDQENVVQSYDYAIYNRFEKYIQDNYSQYGIDMLPQSIYPCGVEWYIAPAGWGNEEVPVTAIVGPSVCQYNYDEQGYSTTTIRTYDDMVKDADERLKNIIGYVDEDHVLNGKTLESVKAMGANLAVRIYGNEGLSAIWNFNGSTMNLTDSFNLGVTVGTSKNQEKIEALVPNKENSLVLEFAHHGALPIGTSVNIYVDEKYAEGDKLYLYYYNENGELEEVARDVEVHDGFATFALEHCSEYVLSKDEIATARKGNNVQTGTLNVGLYSGLLCISMFGLVWIWKGKKAA